MIELSLITCVNYISAYSGGRCKQLCFHGTNKCCLKHIWELNIPDLVGFFFFFFFLHYSKTFEAGENWPGQAISEVSFRCSVKY